MKLEESRVETEEVDDKDREYRGLNQKHRRESFPKFSFK